MHNQNHVIEKPIKNLVIDNQYQAHLPGKHPHTIILYSPDIDFCVSLQLLFEDMYNIVTTSDLDMLMMMTTAFHPDVVLIDTQLTAGISRRLDLIKKESPSTLTVLFYASIFENSITHQRLLQSVDAAFSKPVDVVEIAQYIYEHTNTVPPENIH